MVLDRRLGLTIALAATSCVMAGCHHHTNDIPAIAATATPSPTTTDTSVASATASPTATATPTPSPTPTLVPASAMTTFNVVASGGSVSLSSSGYGGALMYPSNSSSVASGSYTISTTLSGAIPQPAPSGNPFLYFTMQLSNTVTFVGNFATTPVTLPTAINPAGLTFVETLYDQTMGVQIGSPVTGIVSGQTVQFGSVIPGSFAASSGDVYLFVISHN